MQKLPFRKTHTKNAYLAFHQVPENFSGKRLDQFLSFRYPELSRSKLQKALKHGRIQIDRKGEALSKFFNSKSWNKLQSLSGQCDRYAQEALLEKYALALQSSPKASTRIWPKDEVMVATLPKESDSYQVFDLKKQCIAFEDDHYLVIEKLPYQTVHATNGFLFDNLSLSLKEAFGQEFYPCHRIDRETSGLLVFAKHPRAAQAMVDLMSLEEESRKTSRGIKKVYLALVHGKPKKDSFVLEGSIGPDLQSCLKVKQAFKENEAPSHHFLYCKTSYKTRRIWLNECGYLSLLECSLFTGRQHQIRAQLASIDHPILGDKLYGKSDDFFIRAQREQLNEKEKARLFLDRHALHAWRLSFSHPIKREIVEIEANLPSDMKSLIPE